MEVIMLSSTLNRLSSVLFCLLFANSVSATEVITSDVGSWSAYGGFQTCYGYGGAKACVSDGTYFSSDGVGSGDVVFAYSASYYIYNTFSIPSGFSGSTMYLSMDLMTGPRNSEQGNKTEYVVITVQQKNSSGTAVQTDTINENITNTTMTTYNYTVTKHADATQVYIKISGRDGGYWAGNYGAVIGAGTITLNDGSSSSSSSPTPVYSSGITAAQSSRRAANLPAASGGMEAHIGITGNSNDVTIEQAGDSHYLELGIVGSNNIVDLEQTTDATGGQHYLEASIDGSNNNLDILQSGSPKTAFVGIDGDGNTASIIQRDSGQHYLQLDLIGDGHDATILQEGAGNHAATVELTNGGGPWTFDLTQSGNTGKEYSLPHGMSDGSTTSGTCYVAAGCSLTVIQND
jgi:hypothetical protein